MRRRPVIALGIGAILAGGVAWQDQRRVLGAARAALRAAGTPQSAPTRHGPCEYAVAGDGPPLLMIHGTGGGYDQGLVAARGLRRLGWRIVAPSRFGYLGTPFPADPGPEAQADALADLLDALGIDRLPVIGASAGALPALVFALRHPGRTAALVALVPATHVPGRPAPPPPNAAARWIIERGLRSDAAIWLGIRLAEDRMIATLLATDPALVDAAAPAERARVRAILRAILPVSLREAGLKNDARWAGDPPALPLGRIAAPTLAISAEDDRFGTAAAARHVAAAVPGAELLVFREGGHVLVGHDAEAMAAIDGFLRRV